jgi:hypothetical protein
VVVGDDPDSGPLQVAPPHLKSMHHGKEEEEEEEEEYYICPAR